MKRMSCIVISCIALPIITVFSLILISGLGAFTYNIISSNIDENNIKDFNEATKNGEYIYSFPAYTRFNCIELKKYDAQNSACYFKCTSKIQCTEKISEINDYYLANFDDVEQDFNIIETIDYKAKYLVTDNEDLLLFDGEEAKDHNEIWNLITNLLPQSIIEKYFYSFTLFDSVEDDEYGSVTNVNHPHGWDFAVEIDSYYDSPASLFLYFLYHEVGHILSLDSGQFEEEWTSNCETVEVSSECLKKSSYLYQFYSEYWKEKYEEDKNNYITQYASTSFVEDFAETFSYYIILEDVSLLSDTTRWQEKVLFMEQYPEIVNLRNEAQQMINSNKYLIEPVESRESIQEIYVE